MEACQRESLRAKGGGSAIEDSEAGLRHKGEPQGVQKTEGGDCGIGGGYTAGGGPAELKVGMEKSQRMVQVCGQPFASARLSYA